MQERFEFVKNIVIGIIPAIITAIFYLFRPEVLKLWLPPILEMIILLIILYKIKSKMRGWKALFLYLSINIIILVIGYIIAPLSIAGGFSIIVLFPEFFVDK